MELLKKGVLLAATIFGVSSPRPGSILEGPAPTPVPVGRVVVVPPENFPPTAIEHFLTRDQVNFIRPGLHIVVNSVTIPDDRRPLVDFSMIDDLGRPLDRAGAITPGPIAVSFILAWWDAGERRYTAYTTRTVTTPPSSPRPGVTAVQAGTDVGGVFTDLAPGHALYKFKTAIPAGDDPTRTHTLGIYSTRTLTDLIGKNYYANVEYDFRPDAQAVTERWGAMDLEKSCNTCHDPLAAHGGARRDVKLCVLCHTPQTTDPDTGNTVDFKVMVHKIHRGASLPSVVAGEPYQIIGFGQSVNDYSTVVFPQDIRNCTTCHNVSAPEAEVWYTRPNRAACASCHDDVNFSTGQNHPAGMQADDRACAACHQPQGDQEWDASIRGAHTVPFKSTQLAGIHATILSVTHSGPGQNPHIEFQLTRNDGVAIAPAAFGANLSVLMGGPTTDYSVDPNGFRERADGASFDGTTATYTFSHPVPANAIGTWAFTLEARRTVTLDPHPNDSATVQESAFNPVFYAAVTDGAPVPRREVVDLARCNTCHDRLAIHGSLRLNTEMCVICHNPNESDAARRPPAEAPPESVDFKRMIHRIHTGTELTRDFTIYGFGGSKNTFNDVRFPGDRRDCETCHVPGSQQLSETPPPGRLSTSTPRDWYSPQRPTAAACLGCHDTQPAAAHAFVNTAPFGEACATCHAPDAEFSVDKVHSR